VSDSVHDDLIFFPFDTSDFSFPPSHFTIHPYVLPPTFGLLHAEEAAARFIIGCQLFENWCGISYQHLVLTIQNDMFAFIKAHIIRSLIRKQQENHVADSVNPTATRIPPKTFLPHTLAFDQHGLEIVIRGFDYLIENGFLILIDSEDESCDVVFPTPELLKVLL